MVDPWPWLVLVRAPGIGPARSARLLARFGTPAAILEAAAAELDACGVPRSAVDYFRNPDREALERDLAWLEQPGCRLVTCHDAAYPRQLQSVGQTPAVLFVRGDSALLGEPQLAIVGTRNPTPTGRRIAEDFGDYLTRAGLVVTSGLALGIDTAAHQGALAAPGPTIAVLGTGPDRIYPARNRELAHRIAEQGALVSEFPPGIAARAEHFPRRNRLISGLSLGTLVVEAARQSGSLITARLATEQGREVFAVPGSIHNPLARGCHWLIRQGAKLVETAADILEELGPQLNAYLRDDTPPGDLGHSGEPFADPRVLLDQEQCALLDQLDAEPIAVDSLVERTGLTADVVSSMLLVLELHGYVQAIPGGRYRRASAEDA